MAPCVIQHRQRLIGYRENGVHHGLMKDDYPDLPHAEEQSAKQTKVSVKTKYVGD